MTAKTVCDALTWAFTFNASDINVAVKADGTPLSLNELLNVEDFPKLKDRMDKSGLFKDNSPIIYLVKCGHKIKENGKCAVHNKTLDKYFDLVDNEGESYYTGSHDDTLRIPKSSNKCEARYCSNCRHYGRKLKYSWETHGTETQPNAYHFNNVLSTLGFTGMEITPDLTEEQKEAVKALGAGTQIKQQKFVVPTPRQPKEKKEVKTTVKKSVSEDDKDKKIAELERQLNELKNLILSQVKPQPIPEPEPQPEPQPVPEPIPEPLPQKEWKEFDGLERNGNRPVKGFLLEDEDGFIGFYAEKDENSQMLGALNRDKIELFEEGYKHFNIQKIVKKVVKK